MKLIIVDVQPNFNIWFSGGFVNLIRKAARLADRTLAIVDETDEREDSYIKADEVIHKQYGGLIRLIIDMGLEDDFCECVTMMRNGVSLEECAELYPEIMKYHGVKDLMKNDMWIDGIKNEQLMSWDGAILCGGGRYECLAEIELVMRSLGLDATIDESMCYAINY